MMIRFGKRFLRRRGRRKIALLGIDSACLVLAYVVNYILAANSDQSPDFRLERYLINFLLTWTLIMTFRMILSVYNNVWRYANVKAYLKMIAADFFGGCCMLGITYAFFHFIEETLYIGVWQSITVVTFFTLMTLSIRLLYQQLHQYRNQDQTAQQNKIRVAIVGAGQVGASLADELRYNKLAHYTPVCFIDVDREKVGSHVSGLPVYAEDDSVFDHLSKLHVQEIFLALPKLTAEEARMKRDFFMRSGCKIKLYDLSYSGYVSDDADDASAVSSARGGDSKRVIREIQIEDLLSRDTKVILNKASRSYYRDQVVLVTGGGGSIGSELCRQVARCRPKRLIVVDIYENNAYDIQQELIRNYGPSLDLCVEIASVRDAQRMECLFAAYRPDIVFHAAAHKHVPLMEHDACEAIKNNVMGTYNTANMAEKYGVKKFILISTDKAVNPTNVMGASKRLCEMVIQCRTDSTTSFSAVRFGNVLGSNGSVIPLFRKQMEKGGPLTVTHRDVVRYFMTIPEASQLVMQAGAMAKSGELFVLDMGKPVRILSLAENMIRLAGMEPYKDIQIVEIGLRPGEKLYEELLIKTENLTKTENELIFVEKDAPLTREQMEENLRLLLEVVTATKDEVETPAIRAVMKSIVPTFKEPDEVNKRAKYADEMKKSDAVDASKVIVGAR